MSDDQGVEWDREELIAAGTSKAVGRPMSACQTTLLCVRCGAISDSGSCYCHDCLDACAEAHQCMDCLADIKITVLPDGRLGIDLFHAPTCPGGRHDDHEARHRDSPPGARSAGCASATSS